MKRLRITVGNKSYDVTVEDLSDADTYHAPMQPAPVQPVGSAPAPAIARESAAKPPQPSVSGAVTSPMAGAIRAILVKPGDAVKRGQGMAILEAMKMENQITAPVDGTVKSIDVAVGDSVAEGQTLVVLE
ncbi:Glutaconyl-CoA decarboxylase subunit gamma [Stieleria maiorica]|uniref:Glutaconyl-CoA decarboxylase subunit gamma n=1 Tax=Stieleria maiorica TaxID=2795974 RepID=A0A5B9MMB3_9BACT|nr:biotin/lipoyl-containing protein [Stieleria maiorica]QEG00775.1 Glutaconyl-CoA decarboxylase subunit gamma [Stieleria maiorica]